MRVQIGTWEEPRERFTPCPERSKIREKLLESENKEGKAREKILESENKALKEKLKRAEKTIKKGT